MNSFGIVGAPFSHALSTTGLKSSNTITWLFEDDSVDVVFYCDDALSVGLSKTHPKKYGMLIESAFVTPQIISEVRDNYKKYCESYDFIFTHNKELLMLDSIFKFIPAVGTWIDEIDLYKKNKLISIISSTKGFTPGQLYRLEWIKKLKNDVDVFGRGFREIPRKEEGLCDYMFSVAIENGSYSTYFTEKILDCFAVGTIPIYHGAPDIGDYFNVDGIVQLTDNFSVSDLSEDLYYSKIEAVKDNYNRVKGMGTAEDWMFEKYFRERLE